MSRRKRKGWRGGDTEGQGQETTKAGKGNRDREKPRQEEGDKERKKVTNTETLRMKQGDTGK